MSVMNSSNSITSAEASPKVQLQLPTSTKQAIKVEAKASRSREWFSPKNATPSIFQKIVAELVGTFILIFVGCGAALTDDVQRLTIVGIAITWAVALIASIYAVGHISGAHFNPAVTIALTAVRKFSWKHAPAYVLAQVLGATLASLVLKVLFNDKGTNFQVTMTQYSDATTVLEAIGWEFVITFILMFIILGAATDDRASKDLCGVAIGGALLGNIMVAGPITGASMNPARSLGPAVVSGVFKNLWVYVVSPIVGALAAALLYSILRLPKPAKPEQSSKSIYNHVFSYPGS